MQTREFQRKVECCMLSASYCSKPSRTLVELAFHPCGLASNQDRVCKRIHSALSKIGVLIHGTIKAILI